MAQKKIEVQTEQTETPEVVQTETEVQIAEAGVVQTETEVQTETAVQTETERLKVLADKIFAVHRILQVHFTSDMVAFFAYNDALTHALGLSDKAIVTIDKEV